MNNISYFESRSGKLTCSAEEAYNFVTDIRNFERFVKHGTIKNWQADKESCSFSVSMLGTVNLRVVEKERFYKVVYDGDALKKNDFSLELRLSDSDKNPAEVKVLLNAELNQIMKMMATKPIIQFLEMLINEMENFRNWKDITV